MSLIVAQLINEPWAGDIYNDVTLLAPGQAGSRNLAHFYDKLNAAIRVVDSRTPVFYEPVTWGILLDGNISGTGFESVQVALGNIFYIFSVITEEQTPNAHHI